MNLNDAVDGAGTIQGLCVGEGWESREPNCNWQCSWACRHANLLLEGVSGFFLRTFFSCNWCFLLQAGREGWLCSEVQRLPGPGRAHHDPAAGPGDGAADAVRVL